MREVMNRTTRRNFLGSALAAGTTLGFATPARVGGSDRKTLLFVGAHMDDSEGGAAGVMFKALAAGHRVVIVQAVSDWSNWPPSQGREKQVEAGVMRVAQQMGAEKILLGYKYHYVPVDLEVKRRIAEIEDRVKPDVAFIMSMNDYWTDHTNIGRAAKDGLLEAHGYLARRVKKPATILAFPGSPLQTYEFKPDTFIDVTDVIDRVSWLLNELGPDGSILGRDGPKYTAHLTLEGPAERGYPKTMDLISETETELAQRKWWGDMCGVRYAEAFQSIMPATRKLEELLGLPPLGID